MATFPQLSTGAVTQYPAGFAASQQVSIVRFIDASGQRWLTQGKQLRRWRVQLNLLTEAELAQIEAFFETQVGEYQVFTFTDPASGTAVQNCRFGGPELTTEYIDVDRGATSLWIVETNA